VTKGERQNMSQTLFPFQVPTIGDTNLRQAISIDWSDMALHHFINGQWSVKMHVKNK